jgi:hypothetical protein
MTTQTTDRIEALAREIAALAAIEHCVETNSGTYGAAEARRAVGCGDPQFADRNIYETVGGARRETGPDAKDAPGRMRRLNRDALAADRRRLAALREELRRLQS